jgi:phosphatidylglycerol lysyltransferase
MPEASATLVRLHGRTATAFRALGPDLTRWGPDAEAFVAYAEVSGALVTAGEPVAAVDRLVPVAEAFIAVARTRGKRAVFFATEGRLVASPALHRRLVGEQPSWDPRGWAAHLRGHRSLREQVRRARAKGVRIATLSAADAATPVWQRAIGDLLARWRATRSMAPMQFLVAIDLATQAEARRLFVAVQEERLVALLALAPVPARTGWLFEHLLRDPDAPNGTAELLVDRAMRALAAEQVSWVTLGLAPLHGPVDGWLRRIRGWSRPLFNFAGLAAFKQKLGPERWEPIYVAWPREDHGWRALRDGLRAFAGGTLWRFGVRTLLRGPSPLLRLLELALVPWTIALALAPTAPWFPSLLVHTLWLAFDGALLLALRVLRQATLQRGVAARQRAARLAQWVALAVSADAVITAAQALWWNLPRAEGPRDLLVMAVACAGPLLTAPVLWGAARRLAVLARPHPPIGRISLSA